MRYVRVKISAASARQLFEGCSEEYIRTVCHGRCCGTKQTREGFAVWVPHSERDRLAAVGGVLDDGWLQPTTPGAGCPFHKPSGFCTIHGVKPLGCWLSPFTLNKNNTLVVKNRNRMFTCYRDKGVAKTPAYRAYFHSLVVMFGRVTAKQIKAHLDKGGGDMTVNMTPAIYNDVRASINKHNKKIRPAHQPKRGFNTMAED